LSHYLKTVNEAAAAAYDRPPDETPAREHPISQEARTPPPGVGTPVVYHCRHGEGRMMLQEFPAIVHSHNPNGTVSLIVDYDADDRIRVRSVGLRTPQNDRPSYSLIEPTFYQTMPFAPQGWAEEDVQVRLAALESEPLKPAFQNLSGRLTALEQANVKRKPGRPPKVKG
jgi:hypothetical protein